MRIFAAFTRDTQWQTMLHSNKHKKVKYKKGLIFGKAEDINPPHPLAYAILGGSVVVMEESLVVSSSSGVLFCNCIYFQIPRQRKGAGCLAPPIVVLICPWDMNIEPALSLRVCFLL